jgi:hypothetical protein
MDTSIQHPPLPRISSGFSFFLFILVLLVGGACNQSRIGEIEGTVQLAGMADHEGVQILLPGTQFRAITDSLGGFLITGLTPGEYVVVMSHPGFFEHRETVVVQAGIRTPLAPVFLNEEVLPVGSVSGFVRLQDSENHEDIVVVLMATEFSATTGISGFYRLENIPPGSYILLALKDGWLPTFQKNIEVENGVETQAPELELKPAGWFPTPTPAFSDLGTFVLRGSAFLEGEKVHDGIRVEVRGFPHKFDLTGANGTFEITGLDNSSHTLILSRAGFLNLLIPDAIPVPATSTATIGFRTLQRDEKSAEGMGILQGRVYLEGQPAHANTTVRLLGVAQSVWTDSDGRYMFVGIPAGIHILVAEHPGYVMGRLYGVRILAEQVSAAPDLTLEPEDTQEKQGTNGIHGIALLEGESDHGGITVALQGASLNVVTGPTGEFGFEEVPVGAYTIIFAKGGYKNVYLEGVPVESGDPTMLDSVILQKDIEPPFVVETFPRNGARKVPIIGVVDLVVRFSERMEGGFVKRAVMIDPPVDFDAFFDRESELANFDVLHIRLYQDSPIPVRFNTRYSVMITPEARTPKGVPLAEPFVFSFTTDGPLIVNTFPAYGNENILINSGNPMVIETNAPVDPNSFERSIRFTPKPDSVPLYEYMPMKLGTRIIIRVDLRQNTRHRIQIDNSLRTIDRRRFGNTPYLLVFGTTGGASLRDSGVRQ